MSENNQDKLIVTTDGKQVFTADFVFKQIQAIDARINIIRNVALISLGVSTVSAAITLIKLLC